MAQERCECEPTSVLVFPCSGGSNVGQMANAAAVEMTRRGQAKMYCLAGIGGHIGGMVDSAAHVDCRIAIDGCAVACARKTLEHAGMAADRAVIVTDLGVVKNHDFEWSDQEIECIIQVAGDGMLAMAAKADGSCCCG